MSEQQLDGRTIAFLVADEGVEEVELTAPWEAVEQAGGRPVLISTSGSQVQLMQHLDKSRTRTADLRTADADPSDYAGVVLPGGVANPDQLRTDAAAVAFLRTAVGSGVPVAVICHGPWTLVEAAVVGNRTMTSWPSLRTDLTNAGARWVDDEVVVCEEGSNVMISSRKPDDLPAFCRTLVEHFSRELAADRLGT
jgi:protease I